MAQYLDQIRRFVPSMTTNSYKGQSGKIGVLGGSKEYTGAPYYAAYSALKVGADLSHIFCTESAGIPIKSYSPELIVHPVLKSSSDIQKKELKEDDDKEREFVAQDIVQKVSAWFPSLHVLIVGPGLGRDSFVQYCTKKIIAKAQESKLPMVIDGDGLFLLSTEPSIIKDYPLAVLTPNVVEFGRLCETLKIDVTGEKALESLCDSLGNVTIIRKGPVDYISDGKQTIQCDAEGSPRRCGGQGDFLAGSLGVFMGWANQYPKRESKILSSEISPLILAGYGACFISRQASRAAFYKHFRSTTTPNMIEEIGPVFEQHFPWNAKL